MQFAIIDGHADTACRKFVRGKQRLDDYDGHVTLEAMQKLERYAQFFAYCPVSYDWDGDDETLLQQSHAMFADDMARSGHIITPVGSMAQMFSAWEQGKTAAFQALEGAEGIGCDPGRLERAHAMGFRMVSLMWNYENELGGSHVTGGGLTEKGREFVRRAQKLHMILDMSHASDAVFYEVLELAEKPFIASHSNCRAMIPNSRNLTDDQIRCLAECGGTLGLNLYIPFLTDRQDATFEDMRRHLEHMLEVGGEDVIALGGDLDGITGSPEGFRHVDDYEKFTDYLAGCGFSRTLLEKLCAGNLMRVMDACDLRPM